MSADPFEPSDLRSYVARLLPRIGIPENLRQVMHRIHVWENVRGYHPRTGNLVPSDYAGFIGLGALMPHEKTAAEFHAALIKPTSKDTDHWLWCNADEINDWACAQTYGVELLYPSRVAHLTGFSSKCRIDGRRLYIPIATTDTAIKER